jgi:hypothetical protein
LLELVNQLIMRYGIVNIHFPVNRFTL